MRWPLLLSIAVAALGGGCGSGGAPAAPAAAGAAPPAWLARGTLGPAEVSAALGAPHAELWRRLGPHRFEAKTKVRVSVPGQPADELEDEYLLEAGAGGRFHARHQNSRDQGFEHYVLDRDLYVRPRYGRFVRRRADEGEADRVRENAFGAVGALGDLVGRFAAGRSEGPVTAGGRPAVRVRLALAPTPRPLAAAPEGARAWRATVAVQALAGTLDLDAASGLPLAANVTATFTFRQGDREVTAQLEHASAVATGVDLPLAAPDHLTEPARRRYHVEQQQLLEGLIPPGAGSR
ncbi:MAG TPA: hypothetical protein VGQ83_41830 [Polyangia bacterium]